jgi:4-hydroxy-tetrahydrodipicolinate synthase
LALKLQGAICPTITPFAASGDLDQEFFRKHLAWLLQNKISAIVTSGSTGEFPCLSMSERNELLEIAVDKAGGKVPIVAGTGSTNLRETLELSRNAVRIGADAIMVITPYYFKSSGEALYQYYKQIASQIELPLIPYNNPNRSGVTLAPQIVSRLANEGLIAGYKDSGGNMVKTMEVIANAGRVIPVIQGSDSLALPTYLLGGKGVISACANVAPAAVVSLYDAFLNNDLAGARELQKRISTLDSLVVTAENYPEALKVAMEIAGKPCGHARSIHGEIGSHVRDQVKMILHELKVI